jgi:hypothetical protein
MPEQQTFLSMITGSFCVEQPLDRSYIRQGIR